MSTTSMSIQLSKSQQASCFLEPLGGGYLSCDIQKVRDASTFIPLNIVRGSRPQECEIPSMASNFATTHCSYKYHELRRCGCPELDPNKNKQLWEAYVDSVQNAVVSKLDHQDEITLAIFASGYLLQDCELLDRLFGDDRLKNWAGTLNIQFIDLNYQVNDVQQVQTNIRASTSVDWSKMVPAIVLGICGGASGIYAANANDKKARNVAIVAGIILIIGAIILGGMALDKRSGAISELNIKDPIMKTIDQFLNAIEQQTPLKLHIDFFPNADVCIEKNRKSDVVLGYDIENTLAIFENLKHSNLKSDGKVIVVTKEKTPDEKLLKVMRQAVGPEGKYFTTIFN